MIEQEKNLESKLCKAVREAGGMAIKLASTHAKGLPDRMCLFPGNRVIFAEMKTTGKKPTALQSFTHKQFRELGFDVRVVDSSEKIDVLIARGIE